MTECIVEGILVLKTEIIMVAIGHNIRKYHRQKQKVSKEEMQLA